MRVERAVAAAIVAGVLGLAAVGCSDGDGGPNGGADEARTVQPGAPGEPSRELDDDEADVEAPEHTGADTAFMQHMIVHHQQALTMAGLVADRSGRDDLPTMAERIVESQESEIALMEQWLTDRGEDLPDPADPEHADHELMPGMATSDQLDDLEAARGGDFDRLFLDLMLAHHQGALTMVEDLYADGGGLEPAADHLARGVEADQSIEIGRMQDLQADL
jgi:uncharacterized protein (DUF305 family)